MRTKTKDFTYDELAGVKGEMILLKNPRNGRCTGTVEEFVHPGGGVVFINTGSVSWVSSSGRDTVSGTCLIVFGSNNHMGGLRMSDDFKGYLLCFSNEYMNSLSTELSRSEMTGRLSEGPGIRSLPSGVADTIRKHFELISLNYAYSSKESRMNIIRHISKSLYYNVLETFSIHSDDSTHSQDERIAKRFISLVNTYGHMHRDLSFYCDKLCITTKYLSNIVSRATRKVCTQWLQDATMNKAKFLLRETDKPVSNIAEELGFVTPSDFSRYFRKYEKVNPLSYRNGKGWQKPAL